MKALRPVVAILCFAFTVTLAEASTLTRDRDPVVMVGQDVPWLLGIPVDDVVAFRYQGGWVQIPVQIDERKTVDYGIVYNMDPVDIETLAYADGSTYTGTDTDPAFDADDELVFMAADAGGAAPVDAALPAGVVSGSGVRVLITDPLDAGVGHVYLFRSDGTLLPDAGEDYVSYTFNLLAGSYIPNYDTASGPNFEDSAAQSAFYRTHFSDRWIRDELNILAAGSSGVDILDRHKSMFGPGICQRTENTFSNGEGAFFANIDGPVRAVRSYMGANSGPLTQRDHLFYEQRQDVLTFLRVHAIPGVVDLYDYSPAAGPSPGPPPVTGMTYYNDLNTLGVTVDGVPDAVTSGEIEWEMVTGGQGSVIIAHSFETDIDPFATTSYYSDDSSPSTTQCTGDAFEYATSGPWVNQAIPNTDPSQGSFNNLTARRVVYYDSPGQTVATASLRSDQAATPLNVTAQPFMPGPADTTPALSAQGLVAFLLLAAGAMVVIRRRRPRA